MIQLIKLMINNPINTIIMINKNNNNNNDFKNINLTSNKEK